MEKSISCARLGNKGNSYSSVSCLHYVHRYKVNTMLLSAEEILCTYESNTNMRLRSSFKNTELQLKSTSDVLSFRTVALIH